MNDVPSGPDIFEKLNRIRSFVEKLGVRVVNDVAPSDQARFIGLFQGHTITLFPDSALYGSR